MDSEGLLQIGVFSRLARTSVRMLRHYDEHGLLHPAWVDPDDAAGGSIPALVKVADGRVRPR
jgi:hypothetical protein